MTVLFSGLIPVHYGFLFLASLDDEQPELMQTRQGQQNGLCGAAVTGVLSLVTGLHTGEVPVSVEWHDGEPDLGTEWEDVVEVSFTPTARELQLSAFEHAVDVNLPAIGSLRARFNAAGMDQGRALDTPDEDELAPDRYLLQLWPAAAGPDAVLRQTSTCAQYWHDETRALPPPPSPEEQETAARLARLEAEQAKQAKERADEEWTRNEWGGPLPSPALAALGGNIWGVVHTDRDLLDVFEALTATEQRATARWLVHRTFERAELADLPWVRPALDALDRDAPLPEPFTDLTAAFARLHRPETGTDEAVTPSTTVVASVVESAVPVSEDWTTQAIHRPSFAFPALFSAREPDPLQALVDTFSHADATFNEDRETLLSELRHRLGL